MLNYNPKYYIQCLLLILPFSLSVLNHEVIYSLYEESKLP